MPLSTLDPTPALIVVDLQKGISAYPTIAPFAEIVERSARLAAAFRERGFPVVLVNVDGRAPGLTEAPVAAAGTPAPDWTELVAELDAQPSDLCVTKRTWGAFHGTTLDAQLRERGVTQVVLTGISTSAGVETTARAAYEHGYNVVLATDAMTDRDADVHASSITNIFPRLGETATTDEILARLADG
jgi:nicotinamidase-related amidase